MPDPVTQIVMEGDMVRELRVELVKEVRLTDFMPHIEHRPPVTLGVLPASTRFVYWDETDPKNKHVQLLAELAPGIRTSKMRDNIRHQLSYPWTYFLFDFNTSGDPMEGKNWAHTNTRVFWARENVTGPKSLLYTALVWNCDTNGQICWGSTYSDAAMSLSQRVETLIIDFYRTQFAHTSGAGSPWQSETGHDTWNRWIAETKKNPAAFRNFPEWNLDGKTQKNNPMKSYTLKDLFGTITDRSKPIEVEGRIPDLIIPMTFGRAEEWLANLSDSDVLKLETSIANYRIERAAPAAGNG